MSFTNLSIVKKHLLTGAFGALSMRSHPVTLTGTSEAVLPHHNLVEFSEAVKWDIIVQPVKESPITLSAYNDQALAHEQLVPDSVVVSLSDALTTVYREEADYKVDCIRGSLRRVPGGTIPDQQPLVIHYNHYSVFERDLDYIMDWVGGTLRRVAGGAIPDGAQILVDYDVLAGSASDEMIVQAILEAEDCIVRALRPGYTPFSTDQGLITGSTELVLAIVARDLASECLSRRASSDAAGRAREWRELADLREDRAWRILRPFLEPYGLRSPEKSSNAES